MEIVKTIIPHNGNNTLPEPPIPSATYWLANMSVMHVSCLTMACFFVTISFILSFFHLYFVLKYVSNERIRNDMYALVFMFPKMRDFRVKILNLVIFDMVPIPLVYTQVVNLAVRTYFLVALFGRQFLDANKVIPGAKTKLDIYFPIMTSLQIVFIIGWLKVSEVMLNPLGEDDEDFETNWIIERNLQVGYAVVDQAYGRFPIIKKDPFWEDEHPQTMDTPNSTRKVTSHMQGSCINMNESDLDNGLISYVRRRSRSIDDGDTSSIQTDRTRTNSISMLPRHMWTQPKKKISQVISNLYKSDPEPRRASVAALDLNHRRLSMDILAEKLESPEKTMEISNTNANGDVVIDIAALVQERIRNVKKQSAVKIEIPEDMLEKTEAGGVGAASAVSPSSANVKWFVEEMPVIEEEDEKLHRKTPKNLSASSLAPPPKNDP
uniref:Bestrophin homolog n=1 Tax=Caenorhabditis japonica TaxID=281687 RepID=A0A8R1HJM7_CAEJA